MCAIRYTPCFVNAFPDDLDIRINLPSQSEDLTAPGLPSIRYIIQLHLQIYSVFIQYEKGKISEEMLQRAMYNVISCTE